MKKLLNVLKNAAFLGVGVFLFWLVYRKTDFPEMMSKLSNMNVWYLLLAFIAAVLSHWSRGARWVLLIKPLGYKVSQFNAFLAVMVGYLANAFVPRLGEVSRCVVVNRTNKVGVDKLLGTVVVERLVDVVTLLLILALTLALQFNKISGFFVDYYNKNFGSGESGKLFTTTLLIIVFAALIVIIVSAILLYKRLKDHALIVKLKNVISGFKAGFNTIRQLENLPLFIFHSIFIWCMYYMMVWICFLALPVTAGLGPVVALVVLCMGSFGFVMPVPGGVGAYHGIVIITLGLYGVNAEDSKTFAFVAHTFQESVIIILGALSFIYVTLAFKKIKANDPAASDTAKVIS